jgi:hypothetical protein
MKTKQRTTPFLNPHGKIMNRIGYESKPKMWCLKSCFPTWSDNQIFERSDFQMLNQPRATIPYSSISQDPTMLHSGFQWFGMVWQDHLLIFLLVGAQRLHIF